MYRQSRIYWSNRSNQIENFFCFVIPYACVVWEIESVFTQVLYEVAEEEEEG